MEQPGAGSGKDDGDRSSVPALRVSPPTPSEESKSSLDSMNGSEDMQSGVKGHGEGHPDIQLSGDNKNTEDQESSPSAGHGLIEGTQGTAVDVHSDQNKTPDNPAESGEDYSDAYPVDSICVMPAAPSEEIKTSPSGSEDLQSDANVKDGERHLDLTPSPAVDDNTSTVVQGTSLGPERSDLSERHLYSPAFDDDINTDGQDTSMHPLSYPTDANVKDGERHLDLTPSPAVDDNTSTVVQGKSLGPERSDLSERHLYSPAFDDDINTDGQDMSMHPLSYPTDANVKDGERHLDLAPSPAVDDNTSTVVQGTSVGPERLDPLFLEEENEDREEHFLPRPSTMISTNKGKYYWMLCALVPLIAALVYISQTENHQVETPVRMFLRNFEKVERSFQSQPDQLWKRSRIMLQKHVNATTHSEPSILMFAAALDAETTMRCLSRSIAGAYASALGSTAVEIDGSGKNLLDSDKVKLDLDERLSSAFDKGEKAAIIHHFQDLPPPSTLLFYKYCDHENAAFKDVSLLITVLLPEEKLEPDLSLNDLEEMVYDFLVVKFSVSDTPGQYNALDADKLSGLWSRLSHVILPVRPEKKIEENGCEN